MKNLFSTVLISLFLSPMALADRGGHRLYIGTGTDNIIEYYGYSDSAYLAVEYASPLFFEYEDFNIRWRAAADFSRVGLWAGVGVSAEINLTERLYVEGSLAPGLYRDAEFLDLGHPVSFRTQVGIGYQLNDHADFSIQVAHKSNAGLSELNPGTETVFIRLGFKF